ncbi:MAG: GGDEF domain-containing protein [bacterium]
MTSQSTPPTEPAPQDTPAADQGTALPVHGPLAAAMERLVSLAAAAVRAPFAFIILSGNDRRSFGAGLGLPSWVSHDAGALWRSGIGERIGEGPVVLRDTGDSNGGPEDYAARELGIRSLLGVPIRASTGDLIGVFCAADPEPTQWSDDDQAMLEQFASAAASDWELRHSLAEHEANERRMGFYSNHDVLTGLANRAVLLDRLRFALDRPTLMHRSDNGDAANALPVPDDEIIAVFFLDINNFRAVNDRFGHQVGDRLLASIGKRLRQAAGASACVARLGGDEFAILIERIEGADMAEHMAQRFRDVLSKPTIVGKEEILLTVSVGVSLSTTSVELAEHMLRGADLAMARAKRADHTDILPRPVIFDWAIAAEARAKRRLQDELRDAVVHNELLLHYMPIVRLATGQIEGVEALVRWRHPTRGLMLPSEFLGVAEELDIISEVGRWVLREACRQVVEWNRDVPLGGPLSIAVNLSARQFNATGFLNDVAEAIRGNSLPPRTLVLEVNERVVERDLQRAYGVMTSLRVVGAVIHMDDFGKGNSPLGFLQRLPLDGVKIDHELVNRMDRDERALRLVRSVVGLSREFGLDVVAEGIAAAGHLTTLQEIGCTHGQGPLFSSAVEASVISRMLNARPW